MGVIWHKIWYDLWHNKLRTILVVVSITVGVFAVGTTFGMVEQMLPTMDSAHQNSIPSHITLYLSTPISLDEILSLRRISGIENLEGFNTIEIRWKLLPQDEWRKGNILHRDYENQKYDLLQLKQGMWPNKEGLSVERMHGPFYKIAPGGSILVEVGNGVRRLPITGVIRHPFVPPPNMYDMAWFFGSEDVMELFEIPKGQYNEIKLRVSPYSSDFSHQVATVVKDRLAKQGVGVTSVFYQDPEKHWGRVFLDSMSMVLEVLAIFSLVLSIVLVWNTLTAIITQQTNQIGIIKAIGGSSLTIVKVYLTAVIIYGSLALLIAWPLGAFVSYKISQWFLGMYNIEYSTYALSKNTLIIQAVAALVIPLLAALVPVLAGTNITVRQAISSYGVGGDFGSSWIDRAVERFGRRILASHQAIALGNTFRRKGRLVLTQLVLVSAGLMFLVVLSLSSSLTATLDSEYSRRAHDIIVSFESLQRIDRIKAMSEKISGIQKADLWLVAPATILRRGVKSQDAGLGSQLQGVPVEDPMYSPMIVAGRWLQPGDDRVVVMSKQTADDEKIRLGDKIGLDLGPWGKQEWTVVGFYQVFLMFGGGFSVDAIYAPRQAVYEVTKKNGKGSLLLVRTRQHDKSDVELVNGLLGETLKTNHILVRQSETMPQLRKTTEAAFSYVIIMMLVLAVVIATVGGIGLMGSLWISVIERTKEIGIMRAIGADSKSIQGMFMLEAVIQGVMSWCIAVPISIAVAPLMSNALGKMLFQSELEFRFNYQAVLIWLLIVLAISTFASAIPSRNAAKINVRQSLSYE